MATTGTCDLGSLKNASNGFGFQELPVGAAIFSRWAGRGRFIGAGLRDEAVRLRMFLYDPVGLSKLDDEVDMIAPANCQLIGHRRIVEADLWDRDYLDLAHPWRNGDEAIRIAKRNFFQSPKLTPDEPAVGRDVPQVQFDIANEPRADGEAYGRDIHQLFPATQSHRTTGV